MVVRLTADERQSSNGLRWFANSDLEEIVRSLKLIESLVAVVDFDEDMLSSGALDEIGGSHGRFEDVENYSDLEKMGAWDFSLRRFWESTGRFRCPT